MINIGPLLAGAIIGAIVERFRNPTAPKYGTAALIGAGAVLALAAVNKVLK